MVIQNIDQEILPDAPTPPDRAQLPKGRTLLRNVVLQCRHSGSSFVAAETSIVVDRVPPELIESLMNTDRPIGELLVASRIEFFNEAPEVWIGELPEWIVAPEYRISQHQALARRYTIIISGQPAIVITEHFLPRYSSAVSTTTSRSTRTFGLYRHQGPNSDLKRRHRHQPTVGSSNFFTCRSALRQGPASLRHAGKRMCS
ncbi:MULTISPECIES: chorismate pyruvate-lyase family protein [Mycobacterium ulcerans group]|uniref:chorismate--pyruvate lyase family protein n=1 Tax=Mycobacterium sp. 012931 TaxID=1187065 RepID=UPI002093AA50|nr:MULTISPECIES: chorismate pyruvate-lyase family protein [Mycobacterium ulcerans group]